MSLIVQRRDYGHNPSHWAASRLLFAWRGGVTGARYAQNAVRGREQFIQSGATLVPSRDGFGVSATAADQHWYAVNRNPSAFGGNLTLLWRGVVLGDAGTGNFGMICGVKYGDGSPSQDSVFTLQRRHNLPNNIAVTSNNGVSDVVYTDTDVGLTNYYNIPLTIAVSNVAGTAALTLVIGSPSRGFISQPAMSNLTGGTGNPKATSATDRLTIGDNKGAGRFSNMVTTGFAMWNIAMNAQQLRDVALRSGDVFAAPSTVFSDALMYAGAPPPPPPPGSYWGGYQTIQRPAANFGLRVRS